MIHLKTSVALLVDIPEKNLTRGQVGEVTDIWNDEDFVVTFTVHGDEKKRISTWTKLDQILPLHWGGTRKRAQRLDKARTDAENAAS